jgi:hypothetical protein
MKSGREALVRAKFIRVERRGRSLWLEATDAGWNEAQLSLGRDLPASTSLSVNGIPILQDWLARLGAFLSAHDFSLADFAAAEGSAGAPRFSDLAARIRQAYLEVTGGQFAARARLSELRRHLPDVDRETLDRELLRFHQNDEKARLMRLDNPREITPAEREAQIVFKGEPLHLLWINP